MRRDLRTAAAVLGVLAAAALLLPNAVGAQKVDNPGSFSLRGAAGRIVIGSALDQDLTPSEVPQCSDGIDNDSDNKVDLEDAQCDPGPNGEPASEDDNELVNDFQPKEDVSISGTIAADGTLSIPAAGIYFPTYYVPLTHPIDGSKATVNVKLVATAPATGTLNPLTGEMNFNVKMRVQLSGRLWGNSLSSGCGIGTTSKPISIDFTTDRVPAVGSNPGLNGLPYSTFSGSARVVNNTFSVPGATSCTAGFADLNSTINDAMKLPSASGKNYAILVGETTPIFGAGVSAMITSSPTTGDAPWNVVFNSDGSYVKKGPATYAWDFGDGATSTDANPSHTFSRVGLNTVTLTVTDADGDSASATRVINVTGTPTAAPTPHIVTDPASPSGEAPFTVGFDGSSSVVPGGGGSYAWNFGDGTTGTGATTSHTYLAAGIYTASLKVTDALGQSTSTAVTITVSAGPSEPVVPTARIVTTPTTPTGDAPFSLGFSGATSTVDEGPGTYAWTFGDGATGTGVETSHVYTTPGTYTATLKVTDTTGDSDSTSVTVTVNEAQGPGEPVLPIARVTTTPTTPSGQAPFKVNFSGATSTVDEGPGTYAWTFGDGATATGVTTSHTYTNAGTYTATLKVTDATGDISTDSVTVTVTPKPVEPVSDDTVSVTLRGAISYANSGSGLGNLTIKRDSYGISSVKGTLEIAGTNGGTAKVTVNIQRLWIFEFWTGEVKVSDPGAKINVTTPILGGISGSKSPSTAGSSMSWFKTGSFPNLIQNYSLNWSVVDAD